MGFIEKACHNTGCTSGHGCNVLEFTEKAYALMQGCPCCCDGGGGTGTGEEYLLDTDMTSDEGTENGLTPIASSSSGGWYFPWKAFQSSESTASTDCWCSLYRATESEPQYIGLLMGEKKYVVTKIEIRTRQTGGGGRYPQPPKTFNLKGLDGDQWNDLTALQESDINDWNQTVVIDVPESGQKPVSGVRLEIYSNYTGSIASEQRAIVARLRIYVKDVSGSGSKETLCSFIAETYAAMMDECSCE